MGTRGRLILCVGGHDPSTAGIQADIETCAAFDCLALTVVTAWTTQNTAAVSKVQPAAPDDVVNQIRALLADFRIDACKLGLVPTVAIGERLAQLFEHELRSCPLIVDPLLIAGSGDRLVQEDMTAVFMRRLLPRAAVCTPNVDEALRLSGSDNLPAAVRTLLATGCNAVLVTDTQPRAADIINQLYIGAQADQSFAMERYAGDYHGTGCTLATAIACGLATRRPLHTAVVAAQQFVHAAVAQAWHPGSRQHIPRRNARIRSCP